MEKTLPRELPIDVEELIKILYEAYCSSKKSDLAKLIRHISHQAVSLKTNIALGLTRNFLRQLKKFFRANDDMQSQLLIAQFITDNLNPTELETFKMQITAISSKILSCKMKNALIAELH